MALSLQHYSDFDSSINPFLKERSKQERARSMLIAIENGDCLHENVIIEILSWLPVKDLLKYKCVCKSWYAIISSPYFTSKHLQNYYHNNSDWHGCLLAQYYFTHAELQLFEILLDETPRVLAYDILYRVPMYGSYICGPCDGLYYLFYYDFQRRALWNPAINELKVLPPIIPRPDPPLNTNYAKYEDYGFGFDPVTRDYKVVVIKGYWNITGGTTDYPLSTFVYSLRNDSWKYCGDTLRYYNLDNNKCYTFVDGCYYWLENSVVIYDDHDQKSDVIISFNLATDAFQEINLPNYKQPSSKCLGIYDDSIAFLSVHQKEKDFDLWTLNEGIWTKKFTIGPFPDVRRPMGYWKDNKLLLETVDNKLVICDPHAQDVKDVFQGDKGCQGIFNYMESLVSINDRSNCGQDAGASGESTAKEEEKKEEPADESDEDFGFSLFEETIANL